jgi:hypothetical protein
MTTNIRSLWDKYFEGKTSAEEEQVLRRYFAQGHLPEDMEEYAPVLRFFTDEALALNVLNEIKNESEPVSAPKFRAKNLWSVIAVAAGVLIAVLIVSYPAKQPSASKGNYVWVDGKRITDPTTVRQHAEASLQKVQPETDLIEEQLAFVLE